MNRSRIILISALLTAVAAIAPVALALVLAQADIRERAEQNLGAAAGFLAHDAAGLLRQVDEALTAIGELGSGCSESDLQQLRQLVFDIPEISETGIVTADGRLVCTSWGPVQPPEQLNRPPAQRALRVRHYDRVRIMQRPAVVVARTREDGSEVNALLPTRVLMGVISAELGGHGLSGLIETPGRHIILASGRVPDLQVELERRQIGSQVTLLRARFSDGVERILAARALDGYPHLLAVAAVSEDWLQQDWLEEALPVGLLGLTASLFLVALVVILARRRLSLRGELLRALQQEEFEVHYQPIVDLEHGRCAGAEALLRWRHPEQGLLYPDHFIHLAEDTGIIEPITEWLMRRVAKDLGPLLAQRPQMYVTINLCARHFRQERILHASEAAFGSAGVRAEQLVYEITERSLVEDEGTPAREIMTALRERDSRIALDDFGTGNSCLSYLNSFPLDYLKIDRQFVDAIGSGSVADGLLDSIVEIAGKVELQLVAEGVESEEQERYLQRCGVRFAQGYRYSRALPAEAFRSFVAEGEPRPAGYDGARRDRRCSPGPSRPRSA